jgi:hypothetical protein
MMSRAIETGFSVAGLFGQFIFQGQGSGVVHRFNAAMMATITILSRNTPVIYMNAGNEIASWDRKPPHLGR